MLQGTTWSCCFERTKIKSSPGYRGKIVTNDEIIVLATEKDNKIPILAGSLRPVDRYSNGSFLADEKKDGNVTHIYKDPKAEIE